MWPTFLNYVLGHVTVIFAGEEDKSENRYCFFFGINSCVEKNTTKSI